MPLDDIIKFLLVLLLPFSMIMDTIGMHFRTVGVRLGEPTRAYSAHMRFSSLGRFFIMLAAPMLGYLVDAGNTINDISWVGAGAYGLFIVMILLFGLTENKLVRYLYGLLTRQTSPEKVNVKGRNIIPSFLILAILSYSFWSVGILAVNLIATKYPDSRATVVQMTAVITALGTLLHIFFIDSKLAYHSDYDISQLQNFVWTVVVARLIGACIILVVFLLIIKIG